MKVTFTHSQMEAFAMGYYHARTGQDEQNNYMTPLEIWSYHRGYDTGTQALEVKTKEHESNLPTTTHKEQQHDR